MIAKDKDGVTKVNTDDIFLQELRGSGRIREPADRTPAAAEPSVSWWVRYTPKVNWKCMKQQAEYLALHAQALQYW